ncbi:hypothetical protein BRD09_05605 [Halobacteriales archaeon SW_10_68_16]|jgi:hypothetical protein|nr:MAG: hypothetical protein BRD09_05605 [Halobacteriales archaeon SW_10_68_16]
MAERDGNDDRYDAARRGAAGVPVEHIPEGPAREDESETAADGTTETPTAVAVVGRAGVVLAVGSVGLAVVGAGGIAAGIQPFGNVATVLALAGVTVAMVLGMAYQAYTGDWAGES